MRIRDVSILLLSAALGGAAVSPGKAGEILDTPAALPEGMRAVSISVDSLPGDAPNVGPGDRVDILLTPTPEYQSGSGVILQGILVIAVSKKEDTGAGWPFNEQTVVVDIDAVQAQKLAIARQIGRLSAMPSEPPLCLSDFFSMCGGVRSSRSTCIRTNRSIPLSFRGNMRTSNSTAAVNDVSVGH